LRNTSGGGEGVGSGVILPSLGNIDPSGGVGGEGISGMPGSAGGNGIGGGCPFARSQEQPLGLPISSARDDGQVKPESSGDADTAPSVD